MHHTRRLLRAAAAGVGLLLSTIAPADAATTSSSDDPVVVQDPRDDFTDLAGAKVDVPGGRGLDVLRVRQRIVGKRLVVVSKHRDLTRVNARVNADRLPVGESFSMFSAYVVPRPHKSSRGYSISFDKSGKVVVSDFQNQERPVPCAPAAKRSRIDLDTDRVRYVVPLRCIDKIQSTRTIAQVIRYKILRRYKDDTELVDLEGLDQNDRPAPRVTLR